jgi:hypothetical protein
MYVYYVLYVYMYVYYVLYVCMYVCMYVVYELHFSPCWSLYRTDMCCTEFCHVVLLHSKGKSLSYILSRMCILISIP